MQFKWTATAQPSALPPTHLPLAALHHVHDAPHSLGYHQNGVLEPVVHRGFPEKGKGSSRRDKMHRESPGWVLKRVVCSRVAEQAEGKRKNRRRAPQGITRTGFWSLRSATVQGWTRPRWRAEEGTALRIKIQAQG